MAVAAKLVHLTERIAVAFAGAQNQPPTPHTSNIPRCTFMITPGNYTMIRSRTKRLPHTALSLEHLETRISPAAVNISYAPGGYQSTAYYVDPNGNQEQDTLTPLNPVVLPKVPDSVVTLLKTQFKGYNFTVAKAAPTPTLTVTNYFAAAGSNAVVVNGMLKGGVDGAIGAGLAVSVTNEANFVGGVGYDWIQVLTTNYPTKSVGGVLQGQLQNNDAAPYADNQGGAAPFYLPKLPNILQFQDFSLRPNVVGQINRSAQLFLVIVSARTNVEILPAGIQWGWKTSPRKGGTSLSLTANVNPSSMPAVTGKTNLTVTLNLGSNFADALTEPTGYVYLTAVPALADGQSYYLGRMPISTFTWVRPAVLNLFGLQGDFLVQKIPQAGNYTITAAYNGDANWGGAKGTCALTVNKVGALLELNSSADSVAVGQPVKYVAFEQDLRPALSVEAGPFCFDFGDSFDGGSFTWRVWRAE